MTTREAIAMICFLLLGMFSVSAQAVTLEELRNDPKLTPSRFARHFSSFRFEQRDEVQRPEDFLASKSGDCDDYATLADAVLSEKGYTTRLIAIRMPNHVHVVLYVEETREYLDFNNRGYFFKTVSSKGSITDIARKVARSFGGEWVSASEFSYQNGRKSLLATVGTNGETKPLAVANAAPPGTEAERRNEAL